MPRNEEYDWMFDYVLQFLESDKFDAAIMDFVDEKCFVFEEEDENKLIYTEIHREFCDHVEALINSNLSELGITPEMFFDSCEKARSGRDINATVFERLVAMDDFQTFKKLMTKRNTELQLESIRSFKQVATPSSSKFKSSSRAEGKMDEDIDEFNAAFEGLIDPDELLALKESQRLQFGEMPEEEFQELLFQSLMEMEMIHRQEELEHAELERALLLSLAVEEERLRAMMTDMKLSDDIREEMNAAEDKAGPAESKHEVHVVEEAVVDVKSTPSEEKASSPVAASASSPSPKKVIKPVTNLQPDTFAEIKPLKMKTYNALPLPGIKSSGDAGQLVAELAEKKRTTEEAIRKGAEQLQQQRKAEEELRNKVSDVDPAEMERRAKHMKEQRELLIAKKKAERERKVQAEEERKRKMADENSVKEDSSANNASSNETESKAEADEIAEMRRATMRMALARRLKMDLLEGNEDAKSVEQNPLRANLQRVEQLREDNRKRENILAKQLAALSK